MMNNAQEWIFGFWIQKKQDDSILQEVLLILLKMKNGIYIDYLNLQRNHYDNFNQILFTYCN
jgi:hypothetical protein